MIFACSCLLLFIVALVVKESLNAPTAAPDWWLFVEESAQREATAARPFRLIGPQHGRWIDMGFIDTRDSGYGYTLGYPDPGAE